MYKFFKHILKFTIFLPRSLFVKIKNLSIPKLHFDVIIFNTRMVSKVPKSHRYSTKFFMKGHFRKIFGNRVDAPEASRSKLIAFKSANKSLVRLG